MAIGRLTRTLLSACLIAGAINCGWAQDELRSLKAFEFGRSRQAWNNMDRQVRATLNRDRRAAEQQLIEVLLARDSTTDAKILACRGLRYVGSKSGGVEETQLSGVDALLSLVKDDRLSAEACAALQEKDFKEINPALREALPLAPNELKAGLINILGRRRDREAADVIAKLAKSITDHKVFTAAVGALGQIGGVEGITALQQLTSENTQLEDKRMHALLAAAAHALEQDIDSRKAGASVLRQMMANDGNSTLIRGAAMVELATVDPDTRALLCLQALQSPKDFLPTAASIFTLLSVKEIKPLYTNAFDRLSVTAKILLVELWQPEYQEAKKIQELSLDAAADPVLRKTAVRAIDRNR